MLRASYTCVHTQSQVVGMSLCRQFSRTRDGHQRPVRSCVSHDRQNRIAPATRPDPTDPAKNSSRPDLLSVRRVINLRMKGASICWTEQHAEGMLHLRAHAKNGRWKELEADVLANTGWLPTSRRVSQAA